MIKRSLVVVVLFLSACNQKLESVPSIAQQKKQVDSLLQIQVKEMEAEHAERLKDRLSIELKLRIDSIAQVHLQQQNTMNAKDSVPQLSDSAYISKLDTTKRL